MKKFYAFIVCVFLLCGFAVTAFAAEGNVACPDSVSVPSGASEVTLPITVTMDTAYAGAEFAIKCSGDITVKSVSYDRKNMSAAMPTEARGYTWFSYFSGSNDFQGDITANVTLSCTGEKDTGVMLYTVAIFTKSSGAVDKEILQPQKNIAVKINADSPASSSDQASQTSSTQPTTTVPAAQVSSSNNGGGSEKNTSNASIAPATEDGSGNKIILCSIILGTSFAVILGCVMINRKTRKKDEQNAI